MLNNKPQQKGQINFQKWSIWKLPGTIVDILKLTNNDSEILYSRQQNGQIRKN